MRVNNAKMYIKMIALGQTSKHMLQPTISTVSCITHTNQVSFALGLPGNRAVTFRRSLLFFFAI